MKLSRVFSRWALVLTGVAAITGLAGSCTVKEDRTNCPCFLYIDLHKLPEKMRMPNSGLWLDVVAHTGSVVKMETISPSDYSAPDWVIVSVPKGNTLVSAANGRVHMKPALDGRSITLPEGYEADSLYMHSDIVDCTGESARDTVRLHKQWCTLSLVLESPDALRHYDFEIQGSWSGISTADLSAIEGKFRTQPRRLTPERFEVRIPRQGDNSLILRLYSENQDGTRGDEEYAYEVGKAIYRAGYDWFRRDLDDVTVKIDVARCDMEVRILPWDPGQNFGDIVI